jgi:hypothetical protein
VRCVAGGLAGCDACVVGGASQAEFWGRVPRCIFVSATPGHWELRQSSRCAAAAADAAVAADAADAAAAAAAADDDADAGEPTADTAAADPEDGGGALREERTGVEGAAAAGGRPGGRRRPAALAAELVIRPTGILDPVVEVRPADGQVLPLTFPARPPPSPCPAVVFCWMASAAAPWVGSEQDASSRKRAPRRTRRARPMAWSGGCWP